MICLVLVLICSFPDLSMFFLSLYNCTHSLPSIEKLLSNTNSRNPTPPPTTTMRNAFFFSSNKLGKNIIFILVNVLFFIPKILKSSRIGSSLASKSKVPFCKIKIKSKELIFYDKGSLMLFTIFLKLLRSDSDSLLSRMRVPIRLVESMPLHSKGQIGV